MQVAWQSGTSAGQAHVYLEHTMFSFLDSCNFALRRLCTGDFTGTHRSDCTGHLTRTPGGPFSVLLWGLIAGFIGAGPGLNLVGIVWIAVFLWFWIAGLREAEWGTR